MDLHPINGCLVATTFVDLVGELHHDKQRHTRVTRQSLKRLVQAGATEVPTGAPAVCVAGIATRTDNFLGIEVIGPDGSIGEFGITELQLSIVARLRALGGGVLRGAPSRVFDDFQRPLTTNYHGAIVEQLEPPGDPSPITAEAFASGFDALKRSLEIPTTAERLGVQWAKSKMLDIRADANPAYVQSSGR